MKLITWNCNGAFRNKYKRLDSFNADVLIIQECENPALSTQNYQKWAGDYLWIGTSKNKGLGIFPKNDNKVTALNWNGSFSINSLKSNCPSLKWNTTDLQLFLPFSINNTLNVLGVWTKGSDSEVFSYVGQFWKYLQIHRNELSQENTIILGDFNSNSIWDKSDRWWNHTSVVNELTEIGFSSLYHHKKNEDQGKESESTFFLQRNISKPYHIDYVFCFKKLISASKLSVGKKEKWLDISDHMPIFVEVDI